MFDWSAKEKIILPIMIVVLLIFAVGICLLTRNKSERIKRLPLFIITIILLILEVAKQIYNICIGYNLWAIPLHFCSLFMFFYSFSNFGKGKLKRFGDIMTVCCTFLVIVLFYLNPSNIIAESCENVFANFSYFHTFTYHHLLFLYYFIFLGSNLIVAKFSDLIYILIGFGNGAYDMYDHIAIYESAKDNYQTSYVTFEKFIEGAATMLIPLLSYTILQETVNAIRITFLISIISYAILFMYYKFRKK